jgi:hypothetical protein
LKRSGRQQRRQQLHRSHQFCRPSARLSECLFLDAMIHREQIAMVREELLNDSTQ